MYRDSWRHKEERVKERKAISGHACSSAAKTKIPRTGVPVPCIGHWFDENLGLCDLIIEPLSSRQSLEGRLALLASLPLVRLASFPVCCPIMEVAGSSGSSLSSFLCVPLFCRLSSQLLCLPGGDQAMQVVHFTL